MDVQPQSCRDGYVCSGSSCKTSCTVDADCLDSYFCSGSRCHLDAIAIDGAGEHTCALLIDGTVRCWGRNDGGELGNGTNANSSLPVQVSNLTNVTAVSVGGLHTCAISGGAAFCWGVNAFGEVGNGMVGTNALTPQMVPGLGTVKSIGTGSSHTCAAITDGTVRCWGLGTSGQLGNGLMTSSSAPAAAVTGINNAAAVTCGALFSCALLMDGTARCWGRGTEGQLGNNTVVNSSTPVDVASLTGSGVLTGAYFIAAGTQHACALSTSGAVCWGNGLSGELGNNMNVSSSSPVGVLGGGFAGAAAIDGGTAHTCVLSGGLVSCWGDDTDGQLGTGLPIMNSPKPVSVNGLIQMTGLTTGDLSSCAIRPNGSAVCWGRNDYGQLGIGNATDQPAPTAVMGW
jgi:alpha-tubulin suppressor-like RCC1 family protein